MQAETSLARKIHHPKDTRWGDAVNCGDYVFLRPPGKTWLTGALSPLALPYLAQRDPFKRFSLGHRNHRLLHCPRPGYFLSVYCFGLKNRFFLIVGLGGRGIFLDKELLLEGGMKFSRSSKTTSLRAHSHANFNTMTRRCQLW